MLFNKKNPDVCVQIMSWNPHLQFTENCINQILKLNLFTIMAWDIKNGPSLEKSIPNLRSLTLIDIFLKIPPCLGGARIPFIIQNMLTIPIIESLNFKTIFSLSGDIYIEKPENFNEVYEYSLDYDLVPYWVDSSKIGTMIWFIKTNVLKRIFEYVIQNEQKYENYHQRGLTMEKMIMDAVIENNFTFPKVGNMRFNYRIPIGIGEKGFLCETLGIRHLQMENKQRAQQGLKPDILTDLKYL